MIKLTVIDYKKLATQHIENQRTAEVKDEQETILSAIVPHNVDPDKVRRHYEAILRTCEISRFHTLDDWAKAHSKTYWELCVYLGECVPDMTITDMHDVVEAKCNRIVNMLVQVHEQIDNIEAELRRDMYDAVLAFQTGDEEEIARLRHKGGLKDLDS